MPSLKTQIGWCNRAQSALLGGLGVAAALFYVAAWRPHQAALRDLSSKIAQTQRDLEVSEAQGRNLSKTTENVARLRHEVTGFKTLPPNPDLGEFAIRISELEKRNNLRALSSNWASTPKRDDEFYELPVSFKFEGDFRDVFGFLCQVEEMPRLTRIQSVKIDPLDAHGAVRVELSLNLYYSEG